MFVYKKTQGGSKGQNLVKVSLDDSKTMSVGQAVMGYTQTDDVITHGAAALPLLGIMTAIVDKYGNPIVGDAIAAGTASSPTVTEVTTAADNTTSKLYWGLVNTSKDTIYSVDVSGTLGTTAQSDKRGARLDVNSANTTYTQLLETTATRTLGTPANFYSHGPDPENSARLLVSLALSEKDSVYE